MGAPGPLYPPHPLRARAELGSAHLGVRVTDRAQLLRPAPLLLRVQAGRGRPSGADGALRCVASTHRVAGPSCCQPCY